MYNSSIQNRSYLNFDEMKSALVQHKYHQFNKLWGKMCINKRYTYRSELKKFGEELESELDIKKLKLVEIHSELYDKKISYEKMRTKIFSYAIPTNMTSLLQFVNWSDIIEMKYNKIECLIFIYGLCFRICQMHDIKLISKLLTEYREWNVNNSYIYEDANLDEYDFIMSCMDILVRCKNSLLTNSKDFLEEILSETFYFKSISLLNLFIHDLHNLYSMTTIINRLISTDNNFLQKVLSKNPKLNFNGIKISDPDLSVETFKILLDRNILNELIFDKNIVSSLVKQTSDVISTGYLTYYDHYKVEWNEKIDVLLNCTKLLIKNPIYSVPTNLFLLEHKSLIPKFTFNRIFDLNIDVLIKQLTGFYLGTFRILPDEIRKIIIYFYLIKN